ncbi:MAG: TetR/AcrR family transcriptional regulator [Deltaproteobacteria bacterium]|nr:TetR/AcrR family transcriptional regulator [Deltaproteobacteria bacterium]
MSRKEAILLAATQLFAKRGFSATPTSAIAKEAGVAEGLIFHYFRTKEGILSNLLNEMTESYLSESRDRMDHCATGLDAIKASIRFHFQFSRDNSEALAVLIRDFPFSVPRGGETLSKLTKDGADRVTHLWEECIDRGKKDGSIRGVPTRETALLLWGMLTGVSRLQILGPIEVPDLTHHIIDFSVRALSGFTEKKGGKAAVLSFSANALLVFS